MASNDEEERLLRSTALQNAQSILIARQRAEEELVRAKEALERKTQELERSEARKTAMFESALDCIISIDHEGTIIEFNASAERTFGYRREDVLGRGLAAAIIPPAYRESHLQGLAHYLATGEGPILNQRLELSAVRADGAEFPVELTVTRIPVDGPPIFTAYLRDITERKRMEDELRQTAADMSEADRRKNEFLAMLAHELRNPLAPIRNAVQVLRLTGGDAQALQSASEMMERQVGQMVRLVDDLLDVSRISRGKIELRKERVELASVVHQAVEAARSLVQCMEHELTISLPPEPIYLNADPVRLAQVLGNLLSNACKFTAKGGRISLTVELEEAEDKEIRRGGDKERQGGDSISLSPPLPLSPSPSHVLIRVRDNGIGLTPDQLPHIFDMFMQVDTSLERTVSGLGIGLTLVKNLAEMHGGTVEVHSGGAGQGSEFVVRLPLWKDEGGRLKDETATDPVHPSAFSLPRSAASSWWTTTGTRPRRWRCC